MAAGLLAALTVAIGADTAQFSEGLKQAQGKLAGFAAKMKGPMLAVGAAVTAAAGGLAVGLKSTIDAADDMSKAASKIGIPIDELSRLKYAADLSGVSFEGLQTGVRKVSSLMADSAAGVASATEAMARYGLSAQNADGSLKSASQIMSEVADKFAAMPDGAEKTAMALDLFGKAGADMIPLLNGGSEALGNLMNEADQFGQVFTEGMGKSSEQFNDNISRLTGAFGTLTADIATRLLPHLASFTDWLVANVPNIAAFVQGVVDFGVSIGRAVAGVIQFGKDGVAAFVAFHAKLQEIGTAIKQFAADVVATLKAIPGQMVEVGKQIIDGLWQGISSAAEGLKNKVTGIASGIKDSFTGFFQIRSPSRVMMGVGQNVVAGLNEGMAGMQGQSEDIAKSIGQTIGDAFAGIINGSMSVKDALKSVLSSVASMMANSAIQSLFGGMGGAGGGFLSSLFGGLFGGGRASGGPVAARTPYMVGERGPEMFVPGQAGRIVPNGDMSGGGGGQSSVVIQLGDGLRASIVQEANQGAVQIVQAGIGQYDKQLDKTLPAKFGKSQMGYG